MTSQYPIWRRAGNLKAKTGDKHILQRLPITRDLSLSKESDKVAFWWTSIKEKPLKLF